MNKSFNDLVKVFKSFAGIGNKSAQRLVIESLNNDKLLAKSLITCLEGAIKNLNKCKYCNSWSENKDQICNICLDISRNKEVLCIVESFIDLLSIENSGAYKGLYFILLGKISPLNNIGPDNIGIDNLITFIKNKKVKEIILALDSSLEGEITNKYIYNMLKNYDKNILLSSLAKGIPYGADLDYLDNKTILYAFNMRKNYNKS